MESYSSEEFGIAVIILNYRSAPLCMDCLWSLKAERAAECDFRFRCIVVDGASGDGSATVIRNAIDLNGWSEWVQLIELTENGGFAFGNNAALKVLLEKDASFECALLLNPDTIVRAGAILQLARFLREHTGVGVVGSQLENADGSLEPSARRSPGILSELCRGASLGLLDRILRNSVVSMPISERPFPCDWVSGAAMMIRRKVFEDIGLLDEGFFLYFEELDFCDRARKAGWEVWLEPASVVMHLEGASTGVGQSMKRRSRHWYDSRSRYFRKHHGLFRWLLADFAWLLGSLSRSVRRLLRLGRGSTDGVHSEFRDLIIGDLRRVIRKQQPLSGEKI